MSRPLLAAALAALVLLSGCSFLGGGGATPTANTDDATPTATPTATLTATPTATPSPTSSGPDYPDGYGQLGVTNSTVAASSHVDSLAAHQSFIVSTVATVLRENGTTRVQQLQSVDIRQDRGLIAVNDSDSVQRTSYFANGTRYLRVNPPGENNTRYNVSNASFDPRGFTGATFVTPALQEVTYGDAEVTETENGTFFSYSATSVNRSSFQLLFGPSINASNVTDFDAGFVVDEEGIVRRMSYQATVDRGDETFVVDVRLQTSSIDEVSVSEPDWVEDARRADSGS